LFSVAFTVISPNTIASKIVCCWFLLPSIAEG
jgi:hypothetical protein